MRIVAGSRRGVTLVAPEGRTTRPTSDRARESLFNILSGPRYRERWQARPVADLFAGTGALGLEALSRRAAHCTFVEREPTAFSALERNIAKSRFGDVSTVLRQDAVGLPAARHTCGLVLLDPPYSDAIAERAVQAALERGWLAPDGIAVVQLHPKTAFEAPKVLETVDDRRYGTARFLIMEPAG